MTLSICQSISIADIIVYSEFSLVNIIAAAIAVTITISVTVMLML